MSLAVLTSRATVGINAPEVTVEVHLAGGLPSMSIVGLPETAVKEAKDRVRAALINANFEFPARRVTINLAPADLKKEGGRFDLAIALGILGANRQLPMQRFEEHELLGELALDGSLRPVRGVLPVALQARESGRILIVPEANGAEAALVPGAIVKTATSLMQVCAYLAGGDDLPLAKPPGPEQAPSYQRDLADVVGQHRARRALEIAAAGAHNLLMIGPPGTGKSMLAARLPGILPEMEDEEALEAAAVASVSPSGFNPTRFRDRPFRSPHHTSSAVALVGGGSNPLPGEISLAHQGVLFLDELPEFPRHVLEVLREPMESGHINIARAQASVRYPARFQLIAAMNPCPCGYLGDGTDRCNCSGSRIERYRAKVSGPLLDRIDLQIDVPRVPVAALTRQSGGEASVNVQRRVSDARRRQTQRAKSPNAFLNERQLRDHCELSSGDRRLLEAAVDKPGLSTRAYTRILKVARTIADLDGNDALATAHVTEAIGYRRSGANATTPSRTFTGVAMAS